MKDNILFLIVSFFLITSPVAVLTWSFLNVLAVAHYDIGMSFLIGAMMYVTGWIMLIYSRKCG